MKFSKKLFSILIVFCTPIVAAQEIQLPFGLKRSEENGMYVTSVENLVHASDVIVKGRYGKLIKSELFYGYDNTRENLSKQFGITDEAELDMMGMPMSEYEVHIDEILKGGERLENVGLLRLRIYEDPQAHKNPTLQEYRSGDHLLFLAENPDRKTYALRGTMFDMKEVNGKYAFKMNQATVTTLEDNDVESFTNYVKAQVDLEK